MSHRFVTIRRDGEALFPRARVASGPVSRMLGLLPRTGLDPEEAMIFPRCRSLHTFFMRFAIDILFLEEMGRVVRLFAEVPRGRLVFGGSQSHAAVECGPKVAAARRIELGQRLTWTES